MPATKASCFDVFTSRMDKIDYTSICELDKQIHSIGISEIKTTENNGRFYSARIVNGVVWLGNGNTVEAAILNLSSRSTVREHMLAFVKEFYSRELRSAANKIDYDVAFEQWRDAFELNARYAYLFKGLFIHCLTSELSFDMIPSCNIYAAYELGPVPNVPIVGMLQKAMSFGLAKFQVDKERALIINCARFNKWSRLITSFLNAVESSVDYHDAFVGFVYYRMIANLNKSIPRVVSDYGVSFGDSTLTCLGQYVRERLQRFTVVATYLKMSMASQPQVVELNGSAGTGKSFAIRTIVAAFAKHTGIEESEIVFVRPHNAKHWTGYCGQPIVLYDDFNQDVSVDMLNELIHIASGVDYEVPSASIEEKGTKFSSPLILLTTNEAVKDMSTKTIKCRDALMRRIQTTVTVSANPLGCDFINGVLTCVPEKVTSATTRIHLKKTEISVSTFATFLYRTLQEKNVKIDVPQIDFYGFAIEDSIEAQILVRQTNGTTIEQKPKARIHDHLESETNKDWQRQMQAKLRYHQQFGYEHDSNRQPRKAPTAKSTTNAAFGATGKWMQKTTPEEMHRQLAFLSAPPPPTI